MTRALLLGPDKAIHDKSNQQNGNADKKLLGSDKVINAKSISDEDDNCPENFSGYALAKNPTQIATKDRKDSHPDGQRPVNWRIKTEK